MKSLFRAALVPASLLSLPLLIGGLAPREATAATRAGKPAARPASPATHASPSSAAPIDPIVAAEDDRDADAPALRRALLSPDSARRARAAQAYGRIMKPSAIQPLLAALKRERVEGTQVEMIFALGQFGWTRAAAGGQEGKIADSLAAYLNHASPAVRAAAVEALGKTALERAPERVLAALKDASALVRAEAATALARYRLVLRGRDPSAQLADLPAEAATRLAALASDADPAVRRAAAFAIARTKEKRALDAASLLASDSDPVARFYAYAALEKLADPASLPRALMGVTDAEASNRVAALMAVSALKGAAELESSGPTLEKDPAFQVRAAYADALGTLDKGDEAPLGRLLKDPSPTVRASALRALAGRKKGHAESLLKTALEDPSWVIREAAVASSAALGADQGAFLRKALSDADVRVRAAALELLGAMPGPEAYEAIKAALVSPELAERGTASAALADRQEADRAKEAWRCYEASAGEKWVEVRESLVDAFEKIAGDETTGYLRKAAADPASSVSTKAIAALGKRGIHDVSAPAPAPFSRTPYRALKFARNPVVTLDTSKGRIRIECFAQDAPIHVANLVGFVRQGLYNGLPWHRVVPNFVIQGGDPDKTGWGSAGFLLRAEVNRHRYLRGTLGMPRSQGFDTGGIQLFVTHLPTPHLDGQYTVFGQVVDGLDVIDRIEKGDLIQKATVEERR